MPRTQPSGVERAEIYILESVGETYRDYDWLKQGWFPDGRPRDFSEALRRLVAGGRVVTEGGPGTRRQLLVRSPNHPNVY